MDPQQKKDWIEQTATKSGILAVYEDLKEYLRSSRTLTDFHFGYKLFRRFETDLHEQGLRQQIRLALLTSYTNNFLTALIQTDLMLEDIGCEIYTGGYNQVRQDILNPDSELYRFRPDVAILAMEIEDLFPDRVAIFPSFTSSERDDFKNEVLEAYRSLMRHFHDNMPSSGRYSVLVQNQSYPFQAYRGLKEADGSLTRFVRELNKSLEELCRAFPNTYILDNASLMEQHGIEEWRDPRLYYTVHIPVAQRNWLHVSNAYVGYIKAALNLNIKCIVLDLDNTLWGGVLGEEGLEGIQLGSTYPGAVFRKFQQYLLSLYGDGYILAVASKNNWDDVRAVLDQHRSMLLKQNHFAGLKVNWNDKAANIKELSKEIGIATDHMLFVDDNPVEIAKVRSAVPGITCLQLESPPLNFAAQFSRLRCFGKLHITEEDKQRGEWYFRDRQRRDLKNELQSLDTFYRDLDQCLIVHENPKQHIHRIVQLTERTNQFNMTSIRLAERTVKELLDDPEYLLITAELSDRFGDNGLIAYLQVRKTAQTWYLENFLMSCRVLGRTAEEALLDYLVGRAKDERAQSVVAEFVRTKKNASFADFYPRSGFRLASEGSDNKDGSATYSLDVHSYVPRPCAIRVMQKDAYVAQ